MGCRRQPRLPMTLTATLCGMDARGRAFFERVRTRNLSRDGALVEGVSSAVKAGDFVTLRHAGNTTRFRVIWEQPLTNGEREVGMARFGSAPAPVDYTLPDSAPDDYLRPRRAQRRQHPRYQCEVAVELKLHGVRTPMWVTACDISPEGCRVQLPVAVAPLTEMTVGLWLNDAKIWVLGTVTHSLYGCGTGIRFRGLHADARQRLSRAISAHDVEVPDRRVGVPEFAMVGFTC